MSERPYRDETPPTDRSTEDLENFKRTPSEHEVEEDPLDSGRFRSNQVLLVTMVVALVLAVVLALIYL